MLYKVTIPDLVDKAYTHATTPLQALALIVRRTLQEKGFIYYGTGTYQWPRSSPLYSAVLDGQLWRAEEVVKPEAKPPVPQPVQQTLPFEERLAASFAQI